MLDEHITEEVVLSKKNNLGRDLIKELYVDNKLSFFIALFAVLASSFFNVAISWLLQQIIDRASGSESSYSFITLTIISAIIVVAFIVTQGLQYFYKTRFIKEALINYKRSIFSSISRKSISAFSSENTSTYISALTNDANSVEANYVTNVFRLVQLVVTGLISLILMIFYSPLLTLIVFGITLLPIIVSMVSGNKIAFYEKKVSDLNENYTDTIKDSLSGFSVVKSFKAEDVIVKRFDDKNIEVENAKQKRNKVQIFVRTLGQTAGLVSQLGIFIIGAYLSTKMSSVTIGMVIAFTQLMNHVLNPIGEVPEILGNRKAAISLIDKVSKNLDDTTEEKGINIGNALNQGISIRNLSFGYDSDMVIDDINLDIEKGKSYAIVGPSGGGKSTLLSLLIDKNKDYTGSISYDGVDVRNISTESLFDLVSLIEQKVFLFNGTIRDNITLYKSFDDSSIARAVNLSGLDSLINDKGWDYFVGEGGSNLSGGEKQRISIARSLLRNSSVFLVDEATSALDNKTAKHVSESFAKLDGYTRVIITHRLDETYLNSYDGIIVLNDGKVVEKGSFKELMNQKGYFYSLYKLNYNE